MLAILGCALFVAAAFRMSAGFVILFYVITEISLGCTCGNTMTHALQNADRNAWFNTFGQLAGSVESSVAAVILTIFQQNICFAYSLDATIRGAHCIFTVCVVLLCLSLLFQAAAFCKADNSCFENETLFMVYQTTNTCSREIHLDFDGDKIRSVPFVIVCPEPTQALKQYKQK